MRVRSEISTSLCNPGVWCPLQCNITFKVELVLPRIHHIPVYPISLPLWLLYDLNSFSIVFELPSLFHPNTHLILEC